ncbi:hypothetical protein ACIOHS_46475 [Streptomyces sp. NPDC088253]|uniref:hypothetical protein n=1 Tax=Streptomyces sp. NPDC088253 TaxID=3365846 RepID=UPI0038129459
MRNIVIGIFNSLIISMNLGSFSDPSLTVMKTTFCEIGRCSKTGTVPVAESLTGLSAGGFGGAGSGVRLHFCQSVAFGTVLEAGCDEVAAGPVALPPPCAAAAGCHGRHDRACQ